MPQTVDEWFLCGPIELTSMIREALIEHAVDPDHVHLELFFGYADTDRPATYHAQAATVTFTLLGRTSTIELAPGDSLLEGALQHRPETPYACTGGACGTCRAKLTTGTVAMDHSFGLSPADRDAGYVLTCQSHPPARP